jgi:hypothetical protein
LKPLWKKRSSQKIESKLFNFLLGGGISETVSLILVLPRNISHHLPAMSPKHLLLTNLS